MICCVTGHRPKGFSFPRTMENPLFVNYLEEIKQAVEDMVSKGYSHFISGMAEGADLDFAASVLSAREIHPHIILEAALPYPYVPRQTPLVGLETGRDKILPLCDRVVEVSTHYFKGCMQKRNRYMVDSADIVLAIWNGEHSGGTWNTIQYAVLTGKDVRFISV